MAETKPRTPREAGGLIIVQKTKLTIVLTRRPDAASAALESALRAESDKLRQAGLEPGCAVAVEPDAFAGTAHGAEVRDRIDGLLSVDLAQPWPQADLASVCRDLATGLTPAADMSRSALIYGVEHTIFDGEGPLQINFALRRLPATSHAEFAEYWLNVHGRMAREAPRRRPGGYRQLHADPDWSRAIAVLAGFGEADYDGIVTSDHCDVERMRKAFSHPAVSEIALTDERKFIDHSRSAIGLLRKL
jgi:hypothetical protein